MIPQQHFARPGLCCIDNATSDLSRDTLFVRFFASAITTYRCFSYISYLIAISLHGDTNLATMARGNRRRELFDSEKDNNTEESSSHNTISGYAGEAPNERCLE
mmetsp:Transcript_24622/g.44446  ORF Transcript_24622/g.44446 Transcript_24622/m.44446 type:complete len:104 (-) Transcript_24622:1165-1476(-)